MIYEVLLLIGGVGLAAQTLLGFAHFDGVNGGHEFHGGDLHGHAHVHLHFGGGGGDVTGSADGGQAQAEGGEAHGQVSVGAKALGALWALFSPLAIFSLCVGAGAAGLAAQPYIRSGPLVALVAVLGALVFYGLLVRPLSRLIFAFASKPAETLAGAVAREAEAVSRFDTQGRGIVTIPVDGQIVRLLAHLDPDAKEKGHEIAPGDRLLVTAVDNRRNTCTVTRL
jgi:hypothetical protein